MLNPLPGVLDRLDLSRFPVPSGVLHEQKYESSQKHGDEVLRRVADRQRKPFVDGCLSGRLGDDEFAVVASAVVGCAELEPMVEKFLRALDMVAKGREQIARVSGTVGIAWSSEAAHDCGVLLRHADAALYETERLQKGTVQTYQADASVTQLVPGVRFPGVDRLDQMVCGRSTSRRERPVATFL